MSLLESLGLKAKQSEVAASSAPHVSFAQISAKIGLPEEKIAQMATLIRSQGMEDAQMASMMRMATSRGVTCEEIRSMLGSMGISTAQIVRVMQGEGLMEPEEANRLLEAERAEAAKHEEIDEVERRRAFVRKGLILVFWFAVWELLDRIADNRLILAGPIRTFQAMCELVVESDFWIIVGASFGRITVGFLLSFCVGFLLALMAHRHRLFREFVDPIISLLRTLPVASFIILLLIWVGNQMLTIFLAFFIVLPLIYTNVISGFESVDPQMLEMARVFGLSKWRTFLYVYRPAFMPFLLSSTKISLGMTWKSGIMAEVLAIPIPSIGREMNTARTFLNTPDLLAWTVVVMICSYVFEQVFMWLLRKANRPLGEGLGAKAGEGSTAFDFGAGSGAVPELVLDELCKSYGTNHVLRSLNLDLAAGSSTCLMAPSGSGKTTLFRVLLGLESADSGSIEGADAGDISMMFQEDRLCSTLTPIENVALVLDGTAPRDAIRALLAEVLPAECLDQPVLELSGGMRRRVSLVRAMAYPAKLVVLDEPFTGLDVATRKRVIDFIVAHRAGRTLLVATHGEGDAELLGAGTVHLGELQDGASARGVSAKCSEAPCQSEAQGN